MSVFCREGGPGPGMVVERNRASGTGGASSRDRYSSPKVAIAGGYSVTDAVEIFCAFLAIFGYFWGIFKANLQ